MRSACRPTLLFACLMSGLAPGASALPPMRVLDIVSYDCFLNGELVPILFCDGFGCEPNFNGSEFIGGFLDGANIGDPASLIDFGFDDFSNTDGGLKETLLIGTLDVSFSPVQFTLPGEQIITQYAGVTFSLDIGGDLYSASLEGAANMTSRFELGGLPTDRFNYPISGNGGTVQPVSGTITPQGLAPGEYLFTVQSPIASYSYGCPACFSLNMGDIDDSPEGFDVGGGAFAEASLAVSRNVDVGAWLEAGEGLNARAWSFLRQGDSVVVGGTFTSAGGQSANRVVRWDGENWTPFGNGLNGGVLALAEFNGQIIAGGGFTRAVGDSATEILRVARWDGTAWRAMGSGFNFRVNALAVVDGVLYAGGLFTQSGATPVGHIARWNPAENRWDNTGNFNAEVHALLAMPYNPLQPTGPAGLIVGGDFTTMNGNDSRGLAMLVFGAWQNPVAVSGRVQALAYQAFDDGSGFPRPGFVFGGLFTSGALTNIGQFDFDNFSTTALGAGVNGRVNSLYVHQPGPVSVIIAGGEFNSAGGQPASRIARWDVDRWAPLGDGFNDFVGAITLYDDELLVTGEFTSSGSRAINRLARWTLDAPPSPPVCPGDTNSDGIVNFADLNTVLAAFGQTGAGQPGDVNDDGLVSFADLNIVLGNFGVGCD